MTSVRGTDLITNLNSEIVLCYRRIYMTARVVVLAISIFFLVLNGKTINNFEKLLRIYITFTR